MLAYSNAIPADARRHGGPIRELGRLGLGCSSCPSDTRLSPPWERPLGEARIRNDEDHWDCDDRDRRLPGWRRLPGVSLAIYSARDSAGGTARRGGGGNVRVDFTLKTTDDLGDDQ